MNAYDKRLKEIRDEILGLKSSFTQQMLWSNAKVDEMICQIGGLLKEKNTMTGGHEDMQYLYSDDGEWFRFVAGFVGDDSNTVDANGTPLKVGNTVIFNSGFKRMVILNSSLDPMLSQETLLEKQAVKTADCTELNIRTAASAAATVRLESCLEDYQQRQEQEQGSGMTMGFR